MKVKDAIELLSKMNPEAILITSSSNFELGNANVEVKYLHESNEGQEKVEHFRDGFDGGSYKSTTWRQFGGDKSVVVVS